ncbi:MAG TPA: hypothetical protein VGQ59_16430 [Cyclobacteriaceae bacterium]|jgi:hypothetical protein|nr:hypothetical protein [Cyclobacteriaceae bacterium]
MDALASKHLTVSNSYALSTIGRCYYSFLESDQTSLSLKVPAFDSGDQQCYTEYILYSDLLFKLLNKQKAFDFANSALFDVFRYLDARNKSSDFSLPFNKIDNANLRFGQDTVLSPQRFFPVFNVQQISSTLYNEPVFDAFHLFSAVAKHRVINHPVLIDLEKDLTIFVSRSFHTPSKKLLTKAIAGASFRDYEQLDSFFTSLRVLDVSKSIFYKYPYASNISSVFYTELKSSRKFELSFGTRLQYQEIKANEVFLTPSEIYDEAEGDVSKLLGGIEVVETGHSKELFIKLVDLKESWKSIENHFKTPFPAKWLMCVNTTKDVSYWQKQYYLDFPGVQRSLRQDVDEVIKMIYDLDWSSSFLASPLVADAVLPSSALYREATSSFRFRMQESFNAVIDFDDLLNGKATDSEIVVLDPFNVTMLSNMVHLTNRYRIRTIVPDFLYYAHQPFLKYLIARHQYDAVLLGARPRVDTNHETLAAKWKSKKSELLLEIRTKIKKYRSVYLGEQNEEIEAEPPVDFSFDPLLEHEVASLLAERESRSVENNYDILITTENGAELTLKPKTKVLLEERGFLLTTNACVLEKDMRFVPLGDVTANLDRESITNKLSSMPPKALKWRDSLKEKTRSATQVYSLLKNSGLSISLGWFESEWLGTPEGTILLPRGYNDWAIVCGYLNIEDVERAWDCYKCRKNENAMKRAYSSIINYIAPKDAFGVNVDEDVLEHVASLYENHTGILSADSGKDRISNARSIVNGISKNLLLHRVTVIKRLNHE